ncbi:PQQ-like beta-propeller repeat protein [bacterium]|nr:PQQ-like beta-propeller repeat protein [bacterium]
MKTFQRMIAAGVLLLCISSGIAQEAWPQYLGPHRNSVSDQTGILRSWPESGPEVLWTVDVGKGFGGPIIRDGNVYLLDRDDEVGDILRCLDLNTGRERWHFAYDAPGTVNFPGSRSIPALDGTYIYSCGHNGDFYCIDIENQTVVWNHNIWTDFGGGDVPRWAVTQNPLIYGDLVILASQAPQAGVVAYNKLSGELAWKTPALGAVGYVSPSIVRVSGEDHVVMITAAEGRGDDTHGGKVIGIDPLSGRVLWEYGNWQCVIPIPNAVDAGSGKMLISGGYNAGTAMIQAEKTGDGGYRVSELYKTIEFGSHTLPPILDKGYFYAFYSTNERKDGMVCMSMDGEIRWKTKRFPLFDKGSYILADGLFLCTDGMTKLYLIEPDPSEFKPLASAELLEGRQNWAPLALAGGKLLIRDQDRMKCVKVVK